MTNKKPEPGDIFISKAAGSAYRVSAVSPEWVTLEELTQLNTELLHAGTWDQEGEYWILNLRALRWDILGAEFQYVYRVLEEAGHVVYEDADTR